MSPAGLRARALRPPILVLIVLPALGCGTNDAPIAESQEPTVWLTDVTERIGLPGPMREGTYALTEVMGGGVALFDADGDGDLDLLEIRMPPPGAFEEPAPNRFYRQGPDGEFVDATEVSGLGDPGFGQGVAIGDVDNDGDLDVYVTNVGPDAFYRNEGADGFVEATAEAGFGGDAWSTSAAFCDFDRDGFLDLFVAHYVVPDPDQVCTGPDGEVDYCGPQAYEPTYDTLYRNDGSGRFLDVTREMGIDQAGRGLGVVCLDLTGDGWDDVYVANDGEPNHLWVNTGGGAFVEEAILRGVAFNARGEAEASMGIAVGDVNGDGLVDLLLTHLRGETNRLYLQSAPGLFRDASIGFGLGTTDLPYTGFGAGFFDADNDGDPDLAVVNGRVTRGSPLTGAELGSFWNRFGEPNLLYRNEGGSRLVQVEEAAGEFGSRIEVSRGMAFGDIDRDGDLDLAVATLRGLRLYRNDAPPPGTHWMVVRPMVEGRPAIGARVTIVTGDRRATGFSLAAYSYLSSSDPGVHFGLGSLDRVDSIEVRWSDGTIERFPGGRVDREVTLRRGEGEGVES